MPKIEADVLATPKYKSFVKLEAGNDNLIHTNDQRMKPKENQKIFDQILKSLETPKVPNGRSQSKLDLINQQFGIGTNKENFDFSNFSKKNGQRSFMIQGSKKTKFSAHAGRYSVSGSRACSPGKKIELGTSRMNFANLASMQKMNQNNKQFNVTGLKTPQLRNQAPRFEQMMFSKGGDLDMITSAVPDRRSKPLFNESSISGLKGTVMPKIEASADRRRSIIPSFEFEDNTNYNSGGYNFNGQDIAGSDEMQNLWNNEENNFNPNLNNYSQNQLSSEYNTYLGQKRHQPEPMSNFGLMSRQYSGLRSKPDNYKIALKPRSSLSRRSGIRSVAPERYEESPFPKFKELTYSTMKSLKTPDLNHYEKERRRLREKYEMESKMLMERIRNKAKIARGENVQNGGFKKPTSRKSKRGAARPPVIKEGDWLCPNQSCCNINWSKRTSCNLCGSKRPHMSAVKKRPYMVTKLYEANTWSCPKCKNIINATHTFCGICGTNRTKDISEGLEQVKLHNAQKKAVSKKNKAKVKMEDTMPVSLEYSTINSQSKTQPIISDPYDPQNIMEMNLKRNFGGMNMDDSARPEW